MTFLLLIFGFILIEMPIVAFLSVVNDVHQPLPILIMALICTVIDVFIITNRITFHKANGGNEERMRKIRKAVKITAIIIAVCLLPGTWFVSEEGYKANRKKGSSIGIITSQCISNVPAALLLSGFTHNIKNLALGVNIGGLGTLIASMASLISYKQYVNEVPDGKGKYFVTFTVYNVIFLIVLYACTKFFI